MNAEGDDQSQGSQVGTIERVLLAVVASSAGVAAGGPIGGVVGAGLEPALERAYSAFRARLLRNSAEVPRHAAETLGWTEAELVARIESDERLMMLTAIAMHSASQTLWDEKIRALSRMLADGLNDDARVDLSTLLARSLVEVEKPHLQVIMAMVSDANPRRPEVHALEPGQTAILTGRRWSYADLTEHLPHVGAHAMINILATLENTGLLTRDHTDYLTYQPTGYAAMALSYLTGQGGWFEN